MSAWITRIKCTNYTNERSRDEPIIFAKKNTVEISNRKAYHEYFFEDKYIAGLVLQGTEIKSLRAGRGQL